MTPILQVVNWWRGLKPVWRYTFGIFAVVAAGAVALLYQLMQRRTVDPLEKADVRAEQEQAKRSAVVTKAAAALHTDLEDIRKEGEATAVQENKAAAQQVAELSKDRELLAEAAARVGRGESL